MKYIEINKVASVFSGTTPKTGVEEYWNGEIIWITPAEISERSKYITDCERRISEEGFSKTNLKLLPIGTVLLTSRAPIGKVAIAGTSLCTNQGFKNIVCSEQLNSEYLYYFLKGQTDYLNSIGRGATFKEISKSIVEKIRIPLPPVEVQETIANVLDKAQELIDKRKKQIELLDEFLQSVFIDMFGDPVTNPKGWSEKGIIDCCDDKDDIKCGPFGTQLNKSEFQRNGVPLWGIAQINSQFRKRPVDFLTSEKAEELSNYSIEENDIVMSRKGTVGKCALFPTGLPKGIMHSDVLRIRTVKSIVNPSFLCFQLRISKEVERQIAMVSQGAIMAGINVGKLKSIKVLVPPLDIQNKFVSIVEATENQRALMEQSLAGMENNFSSIMQRAFRGELFN